jgi:hypothetical protein
MLALPSRTIRPRRPGLLLRQLEMVSRIDGAAELDRRAARRASSGRRPEMRLRAEAEPAAGTAVAFMTIIVRRADRSAGVIIRLPKPSPIAAHAVLQRRELRRV